MGNIQAQLPCLFPGVGGDSRHLQHPPWKVNLLPPPVPHSVNEGGAGGGCEVSTAPATPSARPTSKRGVWLSPQKSPVVNGPPLCSLPGPTGGDGGGGVFTAPATPSAPFKPNQAGGVAGYHGMRLEHRRPSINLVALPLSPPWSNRRGRRWCSFVPPATPSAPFKPNQAGGVAGYDDFECKEEETQTQTQTRNPCPEKSTTLGRIGSIVRKRSAPFKNSAMHTGLRPRHQRVSTQHSKT